MTESSFDLEGRVAAITGTSRGIGRALALGLAAAGADIVHLNKSESSSPHAEVTAAGRRSHWVHLDLRGEPQKLNDAAEQAIAWQGRVDILVNSAGIVARQPALEQTPETIEDVLQVDLTAPLLLCRAVGAHMLARGSGKIVNIVSLMSFQGGYNVSSYAAAKSGLAGVTRALANEWAPFGINVNAIAPGFIATEINADLRQDETRTAEFQQRIPAKRWGTPEDLSGAVVFLASDAAAYIHGHVLVVDGGWLSR